LKVDEQVVGKTVDEIEAELERGTPAVAVLPQPGSIWLNPQHLEDGEEDIVIERVGAVLKA
jgi:hypothetical protein